MMPSTKGPWLHGAEETWGTPPGEVPIWISPFWLMAWDQYSAGFSVKYSCQHKQAVRSTSPRTALVYIYQCVSYKCEWHLVMIIESEGSALTASLHHSCDWHVLLKEASAKSVVVTHNKAHLHQELRSAEVLQLKQSKAELNQAIWILRKRANVPQVLTFVFLCYTDVISLRMVLGLKLKSQIFLPNKTDLSPAYCSFVIFMLQNFWPIMVAVNI